MSAGRMREAIRYVLSLAAAWAVAIAVRAVVFDRPPTATLLLVAACTLAVSLVLRMTPWRPRV